MKSESPIKVIFVIGKGRSGSTLLDGALGSLNGFFSMGEAWVWRGKAPTSAGICGCGELVANCPVWSRVYARMEAGGHDVTQHAQVARWRADVERWTRTKRLLSVDAEGTGSWPSLEAYVTYAAAFYSAVAAVTGARVLIDSSKWPVNPGPLGLIPNVIPYVLHLVRDPRAVTFSWQRRKHWSEGGEEMARHGSAYSSLSWLARNFIAARVAQRAGPRSLLLRYEDFADRPGEQLRRIADWVGEQPSDLPAPDACTLNIRPGHTLMGNAVRFRSGTVDVRRDDEWKSRLGRASYLTTTLVAAPLLRRFGYTFSSKD